MSLEPPALPEVTTSPSARLGPSGSDFTPKARTPRLGLPLDQALALAAHNEANVSPDPELASARGIRLRRPLGAICLTCKAPWPAGFARNPRLALAGPGLLALILSLLRSLWPRRSGADLRYPHRSSTASRSRGYKAGRRGLGQDTNKKMKKKV